MYGNMRKIRNQRASEWEHGLRRSYVQHMPLSPFLSALGLAMESNEESNEQLVPLIVIVQDLLILLLIIISNNFATPSTLSPLRPLPLLFPPHMRLYSHLQIPIRSHVRPRQDNTAPRGWAAHLIRARLGEQLSD